MTSFDDAEFERTIVISNRPMIDAAPVPEAVGHYLVAIGEGGGGKRVELGAAAVTIGRDARQTLVFAADSEISRIHARVRLVDGEVVAEDLGSTNGTFVEGERLTGPVTLREGNVLRVGRQFFKYERRGKRDVERTQQLDRDLQKASNYVQSLLPAPLADAPVRTEWRFLPSAQLGGDAFGYYWLDPDTFVFYLVDVSGHGVGSAMHSVSVMNVLRQRALPQVDFADPAAVLSSLNTRFQMDGHNGLYFTMWYGVYRPRDRTLTYGSAGHHPAYLVPADRQTALPIGMPGFMIGALPEPTYEVNQTTVPAGSALYLFSDGVFEIVAKDGQRWGLSDFLPFLLEPAIPGTPEPERIYQAVRQASVSAQLEDDFSLVALTFP